MHTLGSAEVIDPLVMTIGKCDLATTRTPSLRLREESATMQRKRGLRIQVRHTLKRAQLRQ